MSYHQFETCQEREVPGLLEQKTAEPQDTSSDCAGKPWPY